MAEYEARQAKFAAAKADKQSAENGLTGAKGAATTDHVADRTPSIQPAASNLSDLSSGDAPLSAAEMAARFNAALGRDKAQTMAAESIASNNAVADQGRLTARQNRQTISETNDDSANIVAQGETGVDPSVHPLMQRASAHLEGDEPVGAWFSQTMMDGLKKYQAMQKQSQPNAGSI